MEFSARGGVTSLRQRVAPSEIRKHVSDLSMGSWISSLLLDSLQNAELADDDFMGQRGDIVSLSELIQAMAYYATTMGYSPSWESSSSSTFEDFERRPGIYKTMLKKIENWSTLSGSKKLSAVKKIIRVRVSEKTTKMCGKPNPLGVFVGDGADMKSIFEETDYKRIICKLHRLGEHGQDDPRFYIHMVYRYYMNDFHRKLADHDKVLRYPSLQKIMDVKIPLHCAVSIPPEFRMFLKAAKGNSVSAETLPVPSKTMPDEVVYGYDFESAVPWVPVMRARIFEMFAGIGVRGSPHLFRQIYPKYLVKGGAGGEEGNQAVIDALARSIEMEDLVQTLHGFRHIGPEKIELLDSILSIDSRVGDIFPSYNNHQFLEEGEQLRERIGFFSQESVRGVFRRIVSKMPSFGNEIYTTLKITFSSMEAFTEYSTTRICMAFKKRSDEVWRDFIIDMRKICCVMHTWSRKTEVDQFLEEHGSTDKYFSGVLDKLA